MSKHTLRSVSRRGALFGSAAALVVAAVAPAIAFADALNPLTDRSLTLSSSSPGWSYTDGSGNSTYAPPNSGANGLKTGNTFDFKVSSDSTGANPRIKSMSFQYCTTSAGSCQAPGNGALDVANKTSNLEVHFPSQAEVASGDFSTVIDSTTGAVKAVPGFTNPLNPSDTSGVYAAKDLTSNFIVIYDNAGTWAQSTGWTLTTHNVENGSPASPTGEDNYIVLTQATGLGIPAGAEARVIFFGTTNNYITNPGDGAFFVKINTYNKEYNAAPSGGQVDLTGLAPTTDANIIDGGVTVANVMNQSIQITTKVLETMQFSVGTVDPNTLSSDTSGDTVQSELDIANGSAIGVSKHTPCDTILKALAPSDPANVLKLGNQAAESSLETTNTYSTHSYWRLSSNSSAGATVYYSGHTLTNTVGDQIDPINSGNPGIKASPAKGAEQFGLALDNTSFSADDTTANGVTPQYSADVTGGNQNYSVNYAQETPYENANDNGKTSIHTASLTADGVIANASWHAPRLYPLVAKTNYNNGTGSINTSPTTQFAFDPTSDTIPVPLASEDSEVVDCVTAKMRYIANIAATTPAGIYTTKINYIAAPQY